MEEPAWILLIDGITVGSVLICDLSIIIAEIDHVIYGRVVDLADIEGDDGITVCFSAVCRVVESPVGEENPRFLPGEGTSEGVSIVHDNGG